MCDDRIPGFATSRAERREKRVTLGARSWFDPIMDKTDRGCHVSNLARVARRAVVAALAMTAAAGCGGSGSDACASTGGDGMLMLNITGHDPGAVTVEGMSGVLEGNRDPRSLPAGAHAVTANRVTTPQTGITSQVFEGTVDQSGRLRARRRDDRRQRDLRAGSHQRQAVGRRRQRARPFDAARVRSGFGRRHGHPGRRQSPPTPAAPTDSPSIAPGTCG